MHNYVDKLFKEVNSSKVLDRSSKSDISEDGDHQCREFEQHNLEAIGELGSENEHSYLNH